MKRTPLYECHKRAGGKFVEFGGWEMPVQYSNLVEEHHTVREKVGLFDVSHMGEVFVTGPKAFEYLQYATSNDVSKLFPGKAQYSLLLNEKGGVVDDIIVYMLGEDNYLLCINAANTDKDVAWLNKQNKIGAKIENVSQHFGQIAVQGPKAVETLVKCLGVPAQDYSSENFKSFCIKEVEDKLAGTRGGKFLIARTGYTGEDGFEIFCEAARAEVLWDSLIEAGAEYGLQPAGLGARDTLRLEACYPLHGHELGDDICALYCGVAWVIKFDKGDFIGKQGLLKQKELGLEQKLVGFEVTGKGIIRHGNEVFNKDGEKVGLVTSGTKTPTVDKALGIGFVDSELAKPGTELLADIRGRKVEIEVRAIPFYRR